MNFVIVVSDTFRRDHLGCYGNTWISTPHIDAFAAAAQVFENAFSASFPTVPHRRDVMTGRFTATYTPWAPLTMEETVIADVLTRAGYLTAMIADTPHILENGFHFDRGFEGWEWIRGQENDRWKTHPRQPRDPAAPGKLRNAEGMRKRHRRSISDRRYESDTFVARTMTCACNWLEDNYREGPFFLYVDTFDPHEPWDAPPWYVERYDADYRGDVVDYPLYARTDFLSEAELKHCRALYAAEVTLVDRWVGRLLEKISDLNLLEDTLVLFTTDHGFLIGEHNIIGKALITERKMSYIPLYEEINHIPWILHMPGANAGRRNAVVQPHDIMPTLLELAKVPVPKSVTGKSFASVITGGPDTHRSVAVSAPFLKGVSAKVTVADGPWRGVFVPSSQEKSNSKDDMAVDGRGKRDTIGDQHEEQLFNLRDDPAMARNIIDGHPDVAARLRREMLDYFQTERTEKRILDLWR